jgi:hypothetical protein
MIALLERLGIILREMKRPSCFSLQPQRAGADSVRMPAFVIFAPI